MQELVAFIMFVLVLTIVFLSSALITCKQTVKEYEEFYEGKQAPQAEPLKLHGNMKVSDGIVPIIKSAKEQIK